VSVGSAYSMIHDSLKFSKVCARLVPNELTEQRKRKRLDVCSQHLARYREEGDTQLTVVSVLQASACNTDTTPTQPHRNANTHRTKNNTTNVVIQQNSRKLLTMDILMSETC